MSLGLSLAVAVAFARTVLPRAVRQLALHATDELYQLTIIAWCLLGSWISGRLVRSTQYDRGPNRTWRLTAGVDTRAPARIHSSILQPNSGNCAVRRACQRSWAPLSLG
jgi:hypothetical protein